MRVISKSVIRTWQNDKGAGKLFSFEVCDESGELRCTCFKEGVDKFYDFLQVDKVLRRTSDRSSFDSTYGPLTTHIPPIFI